MVLLSAYIKRFSVSCMQEFLTQLCNFQFLKTEKEKSLNFFFLNVTSLHDLILCQWPVSADQGLQTKYWCVTWYIVTELVDLLAVLVPDTLTGLASLWPIEQDHPLRTKWKPYTQLDGPAANPCWPLLILPTFDAVKSIAQSQKADMSTSHINF